MENNVENKVENNQDTISAKSQTNFLGYTVQPLAQDKIKKEVILTNGKEKIKYSLIRGEENRIFTGANYPVFSLVLSVENSGQWVKIAQTSKRERMKDFSHFLADQAKKNGKDNFSIVPQGDSFIFIRKNGEENEGNCSVVNQEKRYDVTLNLTTYYLVFSQDRFWIDCEFPFFGIGSMNAFPYGGIFKEDFSAKIKQAIGL